MGFWGIEVKPGKPFHYGAQRKLNVTQATLGDGFSEEKNTLQCTTSTHKSPSFVCTLLPNKIESYPLNLEFDEEDLVVFSVIGPRSIHLSGLRDVDENDSMGKGVGCDSDTSPKNEHREENGEESKPKDVECPASLKRKCENTDEDGQVQDGKKKKNKLNDHGEEEIAHVPETVLYEKQFDSEEIKTKTNKSDVSHAKDGHDGKLSNDEVLVEKKNKKKKNKKKKNKKKKNRETEGAAKP